MSSASQESEEAPVCKKAKTTDHAPARNDEDIHHCLRCHQSFLDADNTEKSCLIEHDYDSFEGSRQGTDWYQGHLTCCGASYKFHRVYDDGETYPEYCFQGPHTADAHKVDYNEKTIKPCTAATCGQENQDKAQVQAAKQKQQHALEQRAEEETRRTTGEEIAALKAAGKRREARYLRADMIGYPYEQGELDSDQDSEGCQEFDYASDSSLVPP